MLLTYLISKEETECFMTNQKQELFKVFKLLLILNYRNFLNKEIN